ncbi:hypothetical protein N0V82_006602 [Gnomoniopsis sp. IMI 355080]|nr:hypothetical protein N0V82_006602 [Gnomoniopsis sp. IMI 355080]
MPVEPLSITASVIGVTRMAYDSCKALNDIIKGLKNAPASLEVLQTGLDSFEAVLKPLERDLTSANVAGLSSQQRASLEALQPVLQLCRTACDDFSKRLTELTSHSNEGRFALRDRFRLHFNDSDIRILKENLAQGQRTLSDALGFANLNIATNNQKLLDERAASFAQSMGDIGGKLKGLELSMEALSVSSARITQKDVAQVRKVLEQHDQILKTSLRVYQPALKETSTLAGTKVKYERALDNARVLAGNIDFHGEAPSTYVESAVASQQARIFNGNMSLEAAKSFWN